MTRPRSSSQAERKEKKGLKKREESRPHSSLRDDRDVALLSRSKLPCEKRGKSRKRKDMTTWVLLTAWRGLVLSGS